MPYPLLTQRLSIEPLGKQDLAKFVSYRQDPDVARYQSWDVSYSEPQALELLESQQNVSIPSAGNWLQLAIHNQATGELLGDLALHCLDQEGLSFEIGFTLSRENQGKGFAIEALKRLITFLFEELRAVTIVANCDQRNYAAAKLLLSLDFKKDASKNWNEFFKGEDVTVEHFVLNSPSSINA